MAKKLVGAPCVREDVLQMFLPTDQPIHEADMVARVSTLAFEGVETRPVDVQVQIASGTVAFTVVGLGTKRSPSRASACARR